MVAVKRAFLVYALVLLAIVGVGHSAVAHGQTDYSHAVRFVDHYTYTSSTGRVYLYSIFQNASPETLDVYASVKVFNAAGQIVGAKSNDERAVPPGEKTIMQFYFDEPFTTVEYNVEAEESWYTPVIQNLAFESHTALKKEIVSVINHGHEPARYVKVHCLFFSGDEVVYYNSRYFTDRHDEIKPGKEITQELSCPHPYDSIMLILTGRGSAR